MAAPSPERIAKAKKDLEQARVRLADLNARMAAEGRRLDTRRKIILGGLLIDAAVKDQHYADVVAELMTRITRPQDYTAFEGWTLPVEQRP